LTEAESYRKFNLVDLVVLAEVSFLLSVGLGDVSGKYLNQVERFDLILRYRGKGLGTVISVERYDCEAVCCLVIDFRERS
jgi:hypothetical protein